MWFCDKKTEKAIKDDCHLSPFLECEEVWEKSVLTILDTNEPLSDFFCFAKLSNIQDTMHSSLCPGIDSFVFFFVQNNVLVSTKLFRVLIVTRPYSRNSFNNYL